MDALNWKKGLHAQQNVRNVERLGRLFSYDAGVLVPIQIVER